MKKIYLLMMILFAFLVACNKDDETEPENNAPDATQQNNGVTTGQYAPFTTGSTFNYKYEDPYNGTSTATWTVIGVKEIDGKYYAEISGFMGAVSNGYFNCESGDYTVYMTASGFIPEMKMIYMKESVSAGTEWQQSITINSGGYEVVNKYVFTFIGKLDNRTVEGVEYSDIINIHLDTYMVMLGQEVLASSDDYYWAKGIGLIEKAGESGNIVLLSYQIN